jgi:(d)CTP diphosphatase
MFPLQPRMTNTPQAIRRGAVAVIARDAKLLVIRRSQFVAAPRALCFPGGGIEASESEEQALVREVQEELAVAVTPRRRLWRSTTRWGVELAWWQADLAAGEEPVPHPAEVESVHWHTLEEMATLEGLLDSNREFLAAIARGEICLD